MGVGQKVSSSIEEDDVVFIFGNTNTNIENHDKSLFEKFSVSSPLSLEERKLVAEMLETDEFQSIQESRDLANL